MAVYTELSERQLAALLAEYDLGQVQALDPIKEGVENSNYRLRTAAGTYILTIYEKRVRREELPFFLGLMEHLAAHGIPCPTPIKARDGKALREVAGKAAAIVTFLKGRWPRSVRAEHCEGVGAGMARMHRAGSTFNLQRPNDLALPNWRALFEQCKDKADTVARGLGDEIRAELDHLEAHWPKGLPAGVIHADMFPDNVFFERERLSGIIDFYFACNDAFAYDLAICLNAWCFESDMSFNITKAKALVGGYRGVRACTDDEIACMPLLARGAAMRFLLTRLYDWLHRVDGALVKPKNPLEYLARLRFHRSVEGARAYGLA
jgi:homoserine kinase type II